MPGKKFVVFIVIFMLIAATALTLMLTQSDRFDTVKQKKSKVVDPKNIAKVTITVEGMTCTACEPTIHMMVNKLPGIVSVKASYQNKNSVVEFDKTQTTLADVLKAIAETGYKTTGYKDATGEHKLSSKELAPQKEPAMKCGAGKCGAAMKCGSAK